MELSMFLAPGETSDVVELAEEAMALGDRLLGHAVHGVESVRQGDVPAAVRPVDAFAMGSLLVILAPTALPAVIGLVQEWLANRPVPAVRMVIDDDVLAVGRASRNQQHRVDAFLRRHAG
ncbi:hypothetical protein I0C86_22330 [Plantactinospora sp. S1510]|uniref:Uncharacterized protein n=1 Tax=Plantactinospora alkalitolerans TaxID=2789879 RepID=A0ABS0H0N4_9ACTN|nr:hypothetical protein [Plantactinospora alkalitolerans]MBF9131682.1 hypothetical protein [Plantactinospora alkalitolerans]